MGQDGSKGLRILRLLLEKSRRILLQRCRVQSLDRNHTSHRSDWRRCKNKRASRTIVGSCQSPYCNPEVCFSIFCFVLYRENDSILCSSLGALKSRDTELLQSLATKFNLSYTAFGVSQSDANAPAYGTLSLSEPFHPGLEPAPLTPIDEAPYHLLSGTIKATYNAHRSLDGDNINVAPSIMSANTGKLKCGGVVSYL
jgi:hypothetical protein